MLVGDAQHSPTASISGSTAQTSAKAISPGGTLSGAKATVSVRGTAIWEMGVM